MEKVLEELFRSFPGLVIFRYIVGHSGIDGSKRQLTLIGKLNGQRFRVTGEGDDHNEAARDLARKRPFRLEIGEEG